MRLPPQVLRRRADGCRRSALFFSRIGDEGRAAHRGPAPALFSKLGPSRQGWSPPPPHTGVCPGRAARAGWFRRSGIFCGNARAIRLPARRRSGIKSPGSRPAQLLRTGALTLHRNTFGRRTRHALCAPEHDAAGAATIDQQHLPGGYPRRRKVLWRCSDQCELNIKPGPPLQIDQPELQHQHLWLARLGRDSSQGVAPCIESVSGAITKHRELLGRVVQRASERSVAPP